MSHRPLSKIFQHPVIKIGLVVQILWGNTIYKHTWTEKTIILLADFHGNKNHHNCLYF